MIVTHNMQQAARVSDMTAFFTVELDDDEQAPHRRASSSTTTTEKIFTNPADQRTEDYVTGKVGLDARARHQPASTSRRSSRELEEQALGGLDLVVAALDRALEALAAPGHRAGRAW